MRFARFKKNGREGIAVSHPEQGFFGSFIDQGESRRICCLR